MKSFAVLATVNALSVQRGDAFPGPILPGSDPIYPRPSDPIDLQLEASVDLQIGVEARARSHVRQTLKDQLRKFLYTSEEAPVESTLLGLGDDDDTVEGARLKAAQMQAQLDKAVADADRKREEQQKAFEMQDSNDPAAQLQGLMNA